jgi:hypothetical protein
MQLGEVAVQAERLRHARLDVAVPVRKKKRI